MQNRLSMQLCTKVWILKYYNQESCGQMATPYLIINTTTHNIHLLLSVNALPQGYTGTVNVS